MTAGKIVDVAMGCNVAAYIEVTASTDVSHSGSAAQKPIFKTDYTSVVPSEDQLRKSI